MQDSVVIAGNGERVKSANWAFVLSHFVLSVGEDGGKIVRARGQDLGL